MKKKFLVMLCLLGTLLMLTACGGGKKAAPAPNGSAAKTTSNAPYLAKNILEDGNFGKELLENLKNRPELKGKTIKVFHGTTVDYNKVEGSVVSFDIWKPGTERDVDHYRYAKGDWKVTPVRITGNGDMNANCMPLEKVRLDLVANMVKVMKEKSKDVQDGKMESGSLIFNINGNNQWLWTVKNSREKWWGTFDLDGNLVSYKRV
jgi:hypothetical protein